MHFQIIKFHYLLQIATFLSTHVSFQCSFNAKWMAATRLTIQHPAKLINNAKFWRI